ncbi:MAG: HEAT repeat domain-containing protein [Chloroflexota bacterium]
MDTIHLLNCPACGAPVPPGVNVKSIFTCHACGSTLVLSDWTGAGSVLCRACGAPNDAGSKYCLSCKRALQAACPMCYTLNPLSAARCKRCGVDLPRAWKRQNNWLADKQRHDQERLQAIQQAQLDTRRFEIDRLLVQLDEPENHPMAIFQLQRYGDEAVDGLLGQLHSPDPDARYGAAHALGLIGDPAAVAPLTGLLEDPEAEVRFWACAALGRLKAAQAVEALGSRLRDASKHVRLAAQEALERIDTPHAREALQRGKKSSWWPFG